MEVMDYFHKCSCSSGGGIEDFLKCAPCPPPEVSYLELWTITVGKLCQKEVCSIARRCRMKESPALSVDCPEHVTPFECGLICIITIVCVLCAAMLVIMIVTVFKRKKAVIRQGTLHVVFNDTDSETSDKSSDRGSVKMARKQANGPKINAGLEENTDVPSQNLEDILDPDTIVIGAVAATNGNATSINGTLKVVQDGMGQQPTNGHTPVTLNGVRNRINSDKSDSSISAKL